MNKKIILAVLVAGMLCAGALAGCKDDSLTPPDRTAEDSTIASEPEKAHYTFVEHSQTTPTTIMSEDKETVYITSTTEKVSFVADSRANREASRAINDTLDAAYQRSKTIYQDLQPDLVALLSDENADLSGLPWSTKVDYTCTRNDGKAISVSEDVEYYSAGTLIGTNRFSYNFDPVTGDQIRNVFYVSGDNESFNAADDVIYKKLLAKYGEEVIDYDNVTASFIDEVLDSWRFTEDGIVMTINAGAVAPEEAGILEVEYTKEELPEFAQKYFN